MFFLTETLLKSQNKLPSVFQLTHESSEKDPFQIGISIIAVTFFMMLLLIYFDLWSNTLAKAKFVVSLHSAPLLC